MTINNPILVDLVNGNVYTKFGQIMSIYSYDIEQKCNSDINQGPFANLQKTTINNPILDLVNVNTKFGQIIHSFLRN